MVRVSTDPVHLPPWPASPFPSTGTVYITTSCRSIQAWANKAQLLCTKIIKSPPPPHTHTHTKQQLWTTTWKTRSSRNPECPCDGCCRPKKGRTRCKRSSWGTRNAKKSKRPLRIFFFLKPKAELNVMQREIEDLCVPFFNPWPS